MLLLLPELEPRLLLPLLQLELLEEPELLQLSEPLDELPLPLDQLLDERLLLEDGRLYELLLPLGVS
ncbi:hypothetical protein C0V77_18795 [Emticicia sp. TH156]|nr:hypothetical protein C0V77_18795 [Emticicia sp. TH156]